MSNDTIRKHWKKFTTDDKYKDYFMSNEDSWMIILNEVKNFIDKNSKRPSQDSKNKKEKIIGKWICTQIKNYKKQTQIMSDDKIRKQWEEFTNDNKYKDYFMSNEDSWIIKLNEVKKFIDKNSKKPTQWSKNNEEKIIGVW